MDIVHFAYFHAVDEYVARGQKSIDIINANPYVLCEEGLDFSFEMAEDIATDLKFELDSEQRVSAGLIYVLRKNLVVSV